MTTPTRAENCVRHAALVVERTKLLHTLARAVQESITKGYDFGITYVSQFARLIQLEAEIDTLHYVCYGVAVSRANAEDVPYKNPHCTINHPGSACNVACGY